MSQRERHAFKESDNGWVFDGSCWCVKCDRRRAEMRARFHVPLPIDVHFPALACDLLWLDDPAT